ncbi:MAG: TolC family outer membrane protein [Betaproteobacteria bacterium]|nr:TolC family outer membrane protein [Betaproteobacteria bacterium]
MPRQLLLSNLIVALLASFAAPSGAETLTQAVARAVARFPEIQGAQSRREATKAQVGQARAEFFPSVNASLGEGRERSNNASTRPLGDDPTLTRREADITVSQLLFDGGAAGGQIRRFGARATGAGFAVTNTAQNVALRAAQAFIEVYRLREQLRIAHENVATHERSLADARLALARSAVEQLSGQLRQAAAVYRYLTGQAPGALDAPEPLQSKLPAQLERALDQVLESHPAVLTAKQEFDAAQYDRDSARARRVAPRVTLDAGGSRNRDLDGVRGANDDLYVMLRLRYNLFRGFGDDERVRETQARIAEALAELERTRNEVERDIRQAWEALAADRARLPQLDRYARASADVAEAYRAQFQLGQRSLLDVLNAENERYNALNGFIAGRAAVTAGEIRLLASLGRLMEALGITMPEQTPRERTP